MPADWVPWFDMKLEMLPSEYWQQSIEDIQIAKALQQARYRGEQRADDEARQQREAERKSAERQAKTDAMLERLKERG